MKENSPATKVTRAGKIKLQTQQAMGDFLMGKLNEKGTIIRSKKLEIDEETDIPFYPYIKREPGEPEDYITSPVESRAKQKKQPTGKKTAKGKKKIKNTPVPKYPRRNSTRAANKFRLNSKVIFHPFVKKENIIIIEDNSEDSKKEIKK
jgi:hypothetical protein